MKLDEKLILAMLEAFEGHEDAFIPVPLLASKVNDSDNLKTDSAASSTAISPKMVFHLLHLQDLEAIMNMHGEYSWSYKPTGQKRGIGGGSIQPAIEKSLESGEFTAPHSYSPFSESAVVRLTATGIQIRSALQSNLENKMKKVVIEFGKLAIPVALTGMIG